MAKSKTKSLQRLDKCVSHMTGLSRQMATRMIKDGDVLVDGEVVLDAALKISLDSVLVIAGFNDDDAFLEDGGISAKQAFAKRVFMLNKPYNFVCADRDKNHRIIVTLFKDELSCNELHSVGRLDIDTTGLLIVTDDGDLNHAITSPKKEISKVYFARLSTPVRKASVKTFLNGIKHPEESKRYLPAILTLLPEKDGQIDFSYQEGEIESSYFACVQLTEGRFHEVKRLFEVVGCEVVELSRIAIGQLTLHEDMPLGSYVPLTSEEIEYIFAEANYDLKSLLPLIKRYYTQLENSALHYLPSSQIS